VAGYSELMEQFIASNPGMASRFSRTIEFPNYSVTELVTIVQGMCYKHQYELSPDALAALTSYFEQVPKGPTFGNGRVARKVFESTVNNQASRIAGRATVGAEELSILLAQDVDTVTEPAPPAPPAPPVQAAPGGGRASRVPGPAARRIAELAGLDEVRAGLADRLARASRDPAERLPSAQLNLVFAGREGSGRRTVAALYAQALAELGRSRTGAVRWLPLSAVPARWPGQAEGFARAMFDEAAGGLLLLETDPEFAVRSPDERDQVLDAIPAALAGRPDLVLVLSADPDELAGLLDNRAALAGCFAQCLRFADYSSAELVRLIARYLAKRGYELDEEASASLAGLFAAAPSGTDAWEAHQIAAHLVTVAQSRIVTAGDVPRLVWQDDPAGEATGPAGEATGPAGEATGPASEPDLAYS